MWHGIEVRVPFLDKALMELIYSIKPEIRYNKKQIKHLLALAFKEQLPKEIWDRPKQGFVFPFEQWMQHIQPSGINTDKLKKIQLDMQKKHLHWSRYWSYILSNRKAGEAFSIKA
jgi:asparagine synthase (glutamine-hydrolysing)